MSVALARLELPLAAGNGDFVAGTALGRDIGILMTWLAGFVAALRRHRPDLAIEGRRGRGYRLILSLPSTPPPSTAMPDTGAPAPATVPAVHRDPLDPFMPPLAEILRDTALVCSETIDAAVARLVAYGVKERRALVRSCENPLGLACPKADRQPGRRNKAEGQ